MESFIYKTYYIQTSHDEIRVLLRFRYNKETYKVTNDEIRTKVLDMSPLVNFVMLRKIVYVIKVT